MLFLFITKIEADINTTQKITETTVAPTKLPEFSIPYTIFEQFISALGEYSPTFVRSEKRYAANTHPPVPKRTVEEDLKSVENNIIEHIVQTPNIHQ